MVRDNTNNEKKRIKQITVTGLFGIFNHTIPLNLDDRVTIIHGPNGFGKTVMLKMLAGLFRMDNRILRKIPFKEFCVDFEDNDNLVVKMNTHSMAFLINGKKLYEEKEKEGDTNEVDDKTAFKVVADYIYNISTEIYIDNKDIYPSQKARLIKNKINEMEANNQIAPVLNSISVHFIETQRLLNIRHLHNTEKGWVRENIIESTVKKYSKELAGKINAQLAKYASLSQSLDRTFPERLFKPMSEQSNMSENAIRTELAALENKRLSLMSTGLLDQEDTTTFQLEDHIDEGKKIMLSVYVEDTRQKLAVFDSLFEKIHLLTTIINKHFLYKRMSISKDRGFVFTTSRDEELPLENLSSGEQHELVLFFELLFRVEPGSLILIDEPELSLHVMWQREFLENILEVARLSDIDILIATHAPAIINDRRDLVVFLKEPAA